MGGHLRRFEDAQPPAGAGAGEEHNAPAAERLGHRVRHGGDRLRLAPRRLQAPTVLGEQQLDDPAGVHAMQLAALGMPRLGGQALPG